MISWIVFQENVPEFFLYTDSASMGTKHKVQNVHSNEHQASENHYAKKIINANCNMVRKSTQIHIFKWSSITYNVTGFIFMYIFKWLIFLQNSMKQETWQFIFKLHWITQFLYCKSSLLLLQADDYHLRQYYQFEIQT